LKEEPREPTVHFARQSQKTSSKSLALELELERPKRSDPAKYTASGAK
jgi:hypothetical protein